MKISTLFILVALGTSSFNVLAAESGQISPVKFLGTVSVSNVRGDMDDAVHALQAKGKALGGKRIKIISLDSSGDSDSFMGVAKVYSR